MEEDIIQRNAVDREPHTPLEKLSGDPVGLFLAGQDLNLSVPSRCHGTLSDGRTLGRRRQPYAVLILHEAPELVEGAHTGKPSVVEDGYRVGQLFGLLEVVCREDEEALLREVVERPPQLSPRQWVESCGGLVEEGDLGGRSECGGHQDLPPLPAGEASVQLRPLIVKTHPPDRLRPSPSGLRVADSPP